MRPRIWAVAYAEMPSAAYCNDTAEVFRLSWGHPSLDPSIDTPMEAQLKAHASHGFLKDQFRTARGSNSMASAEREPITGVSGRSPQRGPGGRAPGGESGGEASLKLNAFLFLRVQWKLQICPIIDICESQ